MLAAAVVGTLLCIASVSLFCIALVLANRDRIDEQRAAQRRFSTAAAVPATPTKTGDEQGEEATPSDSDEIDIDISVTGL